MPGLGFVSSVMVLLDDLLELDNEVCVTVEPWSPQSCQRRRTYYVMQQR